MNKVAIKKFAVESRQKLIKSVIERLEELGITEKETIELVQLGGIYSVKSQTLTEIEKKNRGIILSKIAEKGYEPFVEEVAYTWFNRIIAIRYMEVNGYLPFRTRVLSSEIQGKVDPDIITEIADHIEELELNRNKVIELVEQNQQEELFKYVFIKVCNYFGQFLPVMFEQIEDYTELLLPSVMISNGSVIKDMIELVPEKDWTNQVEIIGWLYQYYISEKKDQVFADLKKNKKITKENIPAATQLFTPEWIVKYMVENSLGRLWLEGHPNEELKSNWKYYLEEAKQEESVEFELTKIKKESEILTPEDLTIIDPAMGSGHILVYAFDVLYQIYQSEGYSEKQIPYLILEKNIYGLDIDNRAGQLAYFALMMKARSYNRRFFREIRKNNIELNVCAIKESNEIQNYDIGKFVNKNVYIEEEIKKIINSYIDIKEFGSLKRLDLINLVEIDNFLDNLSIDGNLFSTGIMNDIRKTLLNLTKQARIMSDKYAVTCTNPPYIGNKSMSRLLYEYLTEFYPYCKMDVYASFIQLCKSITKDNGYFSMITQQSWMYLPSYEKLRLNVFKNNILSLLHLGTRAFEEISGEVVQVSAFVARKNNVGNYISCFSKLTQYDSSLKKEESFLLKKDRYYVSVDIFKKIKGAPMSYWLTNQELELLIDCKSIEDAGVTKQGLKSSDDKRFFRYWFEVSNHKIAHSVLNHEDSRQSSAKWFPLNKGGNSKWYGDIKYIINWENDGQEIKEYAAKLYKSYSRTITSIDYYFKECISWPQISMNRPNFRIIESGFIFNAAGPSLFLKEKINIEYALGVLNCKVIDELLQALNPTINFCVGDILKLPYLSVSERDEKIICNLVNRLINISKVNWNLYEISEGFNSHPYILYKNRNLQGSDENWVKVSEEQYKELSETETKMNSIFINACSLQDKLNPSISDSDITMNKAERNKDIKSFISYAVGCMMGRYSLDEEGLIFAGGEFDSSKYETFRADEDGIILISDIEYFEDDLLSRFVEFVKVVYGEETLEENLNFIADTECFKRKSTESARDCLRRYFLKGFMEDHLKVYQKHPIYWMFDSGKQNGFKALIYMHRYNEDMVAKVRTDYLHPLQRKYEAELERLDHLINFDNISASEKGKAKKAQEKLHKQLDECTQYDLLLAHVAHQRIPLDLDDGVKVNYQKFQNIELTADGSSKAKKGDLLYKVKM